LNHTLEVHIHGVREFERLEVRERYDGCRWAEVFDFLELAHDLGAHYTTVLIHQLNGSPLSVVCHTVAHQHIELAFVVLDGQHHGHRLSYLHNARHFRGPGPLADLDLHPALQVVAQKVGRDRV